MAEAKQVESKKMPKGGRKGGTQFPRLNLETAIKYSKKLVSKTHTGPLPQETIFSGVFGASGSRGRIRASALKQYKLLEGPAEAYKATQLAREIDAATDDDRFRLLQRSLLSPKPFNEILQTFQGDTVSKAKIEQRAKALDVHPDSAAECAQLFIESVLTAGLGAMEGDSISLVKSPGITPAVSTQTADDVEELIEDGETETEENTTDESTPNEIQPKTKSEKSRQVPGPTVTLTLNVDPSSDPDKLEKQLKLLRLYGMI